MDIHRELTNAARALIRQWRYTVPAVLVLAVSIGATTVLFSALRGVVLAPLPFDEPESLVKLNHIPLDLAAAGGYVSCPDFVEIRDRCDFFESLAVYYDYREEGLELTGGERPVRVVSMPVSADYFSTLRVRPLFGRTFTKYEELEESGNVVVSHRFWRDHLGGRSDGVGAMVLLDRAPHRVVGILPEWFAEPFGREIDVFVPQNLVPENFLRTDFSLSVVGRLRSGVTLEDAQLRLDTVVSTVDAGNTRRPRWQMRLLPLSEAVVGRTAGILWVLFASCGVVMTIACVSVANLTLARAAMRDRDFAIRSALGAGRGRLVRELFLESALVAGLGGFAGLGIAALVVRMLHLVRPDALPRLEMITINFNVLIFAGAATAGTALLTGLFPAFKLSDGTMQRSLRSSGRASGFGIRFRRFHRVLVVVQLSLAFVLLVAAALLVRTIFNMNRVELGFNPGDVLTFRIDLPEATYEVGNPERRVAFYDQFHERTEALPGVSVSAAVSRLPLTGDYHSWGYRIRAEEESGTEHDQRIADVRAVSGRYFEAIAARVLRGRPFNESDRVDAQPVVLINRAMAERRFGGRDPLGEQIAIGPWMEVVGVVEDVRTTVRGDVPERIYLPYPQVAGAYPWTMSHVVAGATDVDGTLEAVRRELAALDPNLVLFDESTLDAVVEAALGRERSAMWLLASFAAAALILAGVGVFGVLAYMVSRSDREIGIRIALGASMSRVHWAVVREALLLTAAAVTIGAVGSAGLTRGLRSLLFNVSPTDVWTFAAVAVFLFVVAVGASLGPARRAVRVEPMAVLKNE